MADTVAQDDANECRRPPGSKFHQQNMPACQPVWNARSVPRLFLPFGILFVCLGAYLVDQSNRVIEIEIDYTDCTSIGDPLINNGSTSAKCADWIAEHPNTDIQCRCALYFETNRIIPAPVLLYYGLSNFHQNHRRYVASRDDRQLYGTEGYGPLEISKAGTCDGFVPEGNQSTMGYAPCGAIANSLFNDSFTLQLLSLNASERNNSGLVVPLLKTGIAWQSDKQRFRNPSSFSNETWLAPPNWRKPVWLLDPENAANNGYLNEDLIVWMRTAQLATFRKLHRRIDHSADPFKSGLPVSSYVIFVNYSFPVTRFEGRKRVLLTNTCVTGGKNPVLGIMYIVVGSLAVIFAVAFYILDAHIKPGKAEDDQALLVHSISTYSQFSGAATTSGRNP